MDPCNWCAEVMILVTAPVWNTYLIIGFNPEIVEPFFLNGNMKCSQDDNTFFADRWPRKWVEQAILATRYGIYGVKKKFNSCDEHCLPPQYDYSDYWFHWFLSCKCCKFLPFMLCSTTRAIFLGSSGPGVIWGVPVGSFSGRTNSTTVLILH